MSRNARVAMTVNGEQLSAEVPVRMNLVDFIRTKAGLIGSHVGCEHGVCGACTVEVDGVALRGCLMLAIQAGGANVTTIEGLAQSERGECLRKAFKAHNAVQCGYCTPGMLVSALEYIESGGSAERKMIRRHISGNYCRCTGYQSIVDAIAEVIEAGIGT